MVDWEWVGYWMGGILVALVVMMVLVLLLVFMPRAMYVQAECLEAGFPKSHVTWKLEGYCITLEGAVSSPAIPLEKARRR